MLLTETVKIKWHNRNINNFTSKGYIFTKIGDEFEVKVQDLGWSNIEVEVKCDYCERETMKVEYKRYLRIFNSVNPKVACENCKKLKKADSFDYKNRRPKKYWNNRRNRLQELDSYIKTYNNLNNIYSNNKGYNLINMFKKYNHDINDAIVELGYNNNIINYKPKDFYNDLNNLAELIKPLINKYGRFPTFKEIVNELGVRHKQLDTRENLAKIKEILNYKDDMNELIDDSGFLNRSAFEYMTAQFLIHNHIYYKREQSPFLKKEGKFRSDFTFYPSNDKEIHVEIWGCTDGKKETYLNYNKKMEYKLELYKKYDVSLISIYPDVFVGKYEEIQERFLDIFSPILQLKLKKVKQDFLIPGYMMSDEEILAKMMELSDDESTLPSFQQMKEAKCNTLYMNVLKRYKSVAEFANKFDKKPHDTPMNFWTKERIFNLFDKLIKEYGYIVPKSKMNQFYKGLGDAVQRIDSVLNFKLEYFEEKLNKDEAISQTDLEWIKRVSVKKGSDMPVIVTDEQQNRALNILKNYKK